MIKKFFELAGHNISGVGGGGGEKKDISVPAEKAKSFREERAGLASSSSPVLKETQNNLTDEELGRSPGDTLEGAIIDEKYGAAIHEKIREMRRAIDGFYITAMALSLNKIFQSREMSAAITQFQYARQFTGKLLKERGAVAPYKDGDTQRPDQGMLMDFAEFFVPAGTESEQIDVAVNILGKFRNKVEDMITEISLYGQNQPVGNFVEYVCIVSILQGVMSGKHWLGELVPILLAKKK